MVARWRPSCNRDCDARWCVDKAPAPAARLAPALQPQAPNAYSPHFNCLFGLGKKTSIHAARHALPLAGTLWLWPYTHKMLQAACPRPQLTCVPLCVAPSLCAAAVCAGAPGLGAGRVHALPRRRGDLVYVTAAGQPGPPRWRQVRRRPLWKPPMDRCAVCSRLPPVRRHMRYCDLARSIYGTRSGCQGPGFCLDVFCVALKRAQVCRNARVLGGDILPADGIRRQQPDRPNCRRAVHEGASPTTAPRAGVKHCKGCLAAVRTWRP